MSALRKALAKLRLSKDPLDKPNHLTNEKINGKTHGDANGHANGHSHRSGSLGKLIGKNASSEEMLNSEGDPLSKNQLRKQARQREQYQKKKARGQQEQELADRRKDEDEIAAKEEPKEVYARYGELPVNRSEKWTHEMRVDIDSISSKAAGVEVIFRARVHNYRKLSSKLAFFIFRQQTSTIQGVLHEKEGLVSTHMVRWAEHLPTETIVRVKGTVQKPDGHEQITGATVHDAEISITELHVISKLTESPPFDVAEAEVALEETQGDESHKQHLSYRTRIVEPNRIIDLRSSTSQAIFRVNSGVCNLFRSFLDSRGFIEIHTPKLQGGATESGSDVFQVEYFGRPAFLAQSPQLAKQMSIAADFEKVYEVGPVFRAEDSNTHRHMTEYTGLDIEMAIEEHYHEALQMIDEMFKTLFKGIYKSYEREMTVIKRQFPHEKLVWLDETPRIPFKEGVRMLRDSGWKGEDGNPPSEYEDLHTRDEIRLGELVKEKYHTDFYVLDKFPTSARPFYTMLGPEDDRITNSFDIFLRGQEILTGGQRIHDAKMLEARMLDQGMKPGGLDEYMEGFRWGAPPHAGGGIGLERVVMLLLSLGNIRYASLFPRDPKSLPAKPKVLELPHPEADTLNPPWGGRGAPDVEHEFPPLEKLIANYGDASNTSWLDDRYQVWRHNDTGAAVGFVPSGDFAIIVGDPLCDKGQFVKVMSGFLKWVIKEKDLKPLWLLVGHDAEEALGTKLGWRTLTCAAEKREDPNKVRSVVNDREIARKMRHAKKENLKITDVPIKSEVSEDIRRQCDERMKDWLAHRKGKQVHLTNLNPWRDADHRRYFYAQDKDGKVCALVVLAQLSPEHGYQVKYSLDFPDAPNGTIESITIHALQAAADAGASSVTFGGAASESLEPGHNIKGLRVKALSHSYRTITSNLHLLNKGEFRDKLGADDDPIYVCYPKGGLGPKGISAIMSFFTADDE
ncbi:MAG: hypothetical protein M1812_002630 [Candelaria pacifica]|nr:MAG: hypothetical protein M1812_002630 [Candelaria pacifica]